MVNRARSDPFFLGCVLDDHARRKGWDDERLTEQLQCPLDRLPHLFLCRCPDEDDPEFTEQIRRIAEYVPCDATQLLLVLREVTALRKLSDDSPAKTTPFFLAARDRQQTEGQDTNDEKTDADEAP